MSPSAFGEESQNKIEPTGPPPATPQDSGKVTAGSTNTGSGKAVSGSSIAGEDQWRNYGFGVAITYTQDLGKHDRVKNAQVVNGVVRVTEDNNALPRIMLETHYFFKPNGSLFGLFDSVKNTDSNKVWGHGPFVGIQPGSQNIIEAVTIGWMIGFRRPEETATSVTQNSSFNLGLGFVVDPKVQVLGDGMTRNQPLPSGETQVRFKDTAQYGILLMSSFSF